GTAQRAEPHPSSLGGAHPVAEADSGPGSARVLPFGVQGQLQHFRTPQTLQIGDMGPRRRLEREAESVRHAPAASGPPSSRGGGMGGENLRTTKTLSDQRDRSTPPPPGNES